MSADGEPTDDIDAERARLRQVFATPDPDLRVGGDGAAEVRRMRDDDWE